MKTLNELINKYNKPAPRYTSYPPVPYWDKTPTESEWISQIRENYNPITGLDLYVHIPYCEKLCYYCGCNRIITKDHSKEDPFIEVLLREWEIYKKALGFTPKANSLHFGGGTPTFLSPANLERLISTLTENKTMSFIGSIEIDPRTCTLGHLDVLKRNNIKRVSLGIQDFDPVVQKSINRKQSISMVEQLVEQIRKHEIDSINFDLVYGLPKQTIKSVSETIETVIMLKPDLIAFYSYAHLPDRIKNQKLIKENELPSPEEKRQLYETGKKLLIENGYEDIGMDHFALPTSYLYKAKEKDELHRNFMGYVDKKSSVLLGLGPTSISDSSAGFMQNQKEVDQYMATINSGNLAIEKGHIHTRDDLNVQDLILELMCTNKTSLKYMNIPHYNDTLRDLQEFKDDGVIELNDQEIKITSKGISFVRNVAMSFDYRHRQQKTKTKFSQAI